MLRTALSQRILQPGANVGLSVVLDGLVLMTRLAGGKQDGRTEAEMRGITGAINYTFTGEGGASWHLHLKEGRGFFFRGAHGSPIATVSMSVDEFFRLLTGQSSFMVAQMAGRVHVKGDGHAALLLGALIGSLRQGRRHHDRRGRFTRRWTDLAVRLSGTKYPFKD